MRAIAGCLLAVVMASTATAQLPQSPRQKYDYWLRCAAMFEIKAKKAGTARDAAASDTLKVQVQRARDNLLKEGVGLGFAAAQVEKDTKDRVDQFSGLLAQGNKETDASFERAVEICGTSLEP